jgi:hypothetical protein
MPPAKRRGGLEFSISPSGDFVGATVAGARATDYRGTWRPNLAVGEGRGQGNRTGTREAMWG